MTATATSDDIGKAVRATVALAPPSTAATVAEHLAMLKLAEAATAAIRPMLADISPRRCDRLYFRWPLNDLMGPRSWIRVRHMTARGAGARTTQLHRLLGKKAFGNELHREAVPRAAGP